MGEGISGRGLGEVTREIGCKDAFQAGKKNVFSAGE